MEKRKYEFWLDKTAEQIVERERKLKRGIKIFRTESGLGASGFPHIGSFGDVVRNYAVSLALRDLGVKSELIAYSDDRDGLRKVPLTLPDWLEKYIGMPVTDVPDPFKCHSSYGEHMCSLLLDSLDKAGIEYKHRSAKEDYKKGVFNKQIEMILLNSEKAGKVVKELIGQEKFVETLPYFPTCEKCGRIYTTRCYQIIPEEHKVLYTCDQEFTGKNLNTGKEIVVRGCRHKGEVSYFNGFGKLSWKVEFAMRWSALQIVFEAHGKDIVDSVKVNDAICREILNFEPPLHVVYEMFLDKGGKKISKSFGNVFTPQVWFNYGSPNSLILLMLKRFEGTRELDITDIPKYMDELNKLERIYFGKEKVLDERDEVNLLRLYEFVNFLKLPKKQSLQIPYDVLVGIVKILPEENPLEFAIKKLKEFGYIKRIDKSTKRNLEEKLTFARKWYDDFEKPKLITVKISDKEKNAIKNLIKELKTETNGERLQQKIFEIARANDLKPSDFFKLIYKILLESESGPRLGPYIMERGKKEVMEKLKEVL